MNEQAIHRVDEISMKEKHLETTKGYPIFEWSTVIPIMDQADSEPENEETSFHSNEESDDITDYGKKQEKN